MKDYKNILTTLTSDEVENILKALPKGISKDNQIVYVLAVDLFLERNKEETIQAVYVYDDERYDPNPDEVCVCFFTDHSYTEKEVIKANECLIARLYDKMEEAGLNPFDHQTNFIFLKYPGEKVIETNPTWEWVKATRAILWTKTKK